MIRFILASVWKLFLLFFFIHFVSNWTQLEKIFAPCHDIPLNDGPDCDYTLLLVKTLRFLTRGVSTSAANVIEVANFVLFIAKRGTTWIKLRSLYERV